MTIDSNSLRPTRPCGQSAAAHSTITGVTSSAPARSPSHQVSQTEPSAAVSTRPPAARLVTPMVAHNAVGRNAEQREPGDAGRAVEGRLAVRQPIDQVGAQQRFDRVAGADGERGARPMPAVVTLATNAAIRIAGQTR